MRGWQAIVWLVLALAVGVGAGWLGHRYWQAAPAPSARAPVHAAVPPGTVPLAGVQGSTPGVAPNKAARPNVTIAPESPEDFELPSLDPDDIASYIRPGDEEPTAAELIDALRDAGISTGLAAFNPPGTSPALEGLAVPDDFELPEGYVRHHQVTDEGEPIEPILMFSPDLELRDEAGQLIELPADLVVPEELAPPGLPIRRVTPPSP